MAAVAVIALVLLACRFASAQVIAGEKNVSLELSGQLNRGVLVTNDGDSTDVFNVDNDNSSSRFRLVGTYKTTRFSVGTRIEVQVESNSTSDVNQNNKRDDDSDFFGLRKAEIWLNTPFGQLWVGQGSTASDGTAEVDLSGTDVITYSAINELAGGILFYDDAANALTETNVGDVFANFDGLGRDDRIGYDTPTFAGFKLSSSWVTDGYGDVAVRYAGDFSGVKLAAAVSYATKKSVFKSQVTGSVSALHTSGLNATLAGSFQDPDSEGDDRNPYYIYFKFGYTQKLVSFGQTSVSIDYYYGEEISTGNDESQSIGFGLVQKIDVFATELYLGLRNYHLERDTANVDLNHIFAVLTGARVKF